MELRVMILDDEDIILDGLCHFPWGEYGCVVVAKSDNGENGLKLLKESKPDIILSDIKMPEMDGLEFSKRAKEICPDAEIILLTGHDNFLFAKQAIHIGVLEYLLKPINYREMHTAIGKVCNLIRNRRKDEMDYTELKKKYQASLPVVRKKVISDLLYGRFKDGREMQRRMESLSIFIEHYIVIYVSIRTEKDITGQELEPNLFDFVVCNVCEETLKPIGQQVYYDFDNLGYCFIITFPVKKEGIDCEKNLLQVSEIMLKGLKDVLREDVYLGISKAEKNPFNMNYAYVQAVEACEQSFYLGAGSGILTYSDIANIELPVWHVTDGEKKWLLFELMQGNVETAKKFIQEIFEPCPDIEVMRHNVMELLLLSVQYLTKERQQAENFNKGRNTYIAECLKRVYEANTRQEVLNIFKQNVVKLAEKIEDERVSRNQSTSINIMSYIEENYSQDLSLDTLENHFKLSKTYINRLLKKYSKKSFLEILLECRMEKAEELIAGGHYKIFEIAEMVGYHDQSYFIRVFKKKYGVTPNVYKRI